MRCCFARPGFGRFVGGTGMNDHRLERVLKNIYITGAKHRAESVRYADEAPHRRKKCKNHKWGGHQPARLVRLEIVRQMMMFFFIIIVSRLIRRMADQRVRN